MLRQIRTVMQLQFVSDKRKVGYELMSSIAAAAIVCFVLSFSLSPVLTSVSFEAHMASRTDVITGPLQLSQDADSTYVRARGINLSKADIDWDPITDVTPMISVSMPAEIRLNQGSLNSFLGMHSENILESANSTSDGALLDERTAHELNISVGEYVGWVGSNNDFVIMKVGGIVRSYATIDGAQSSALLLLPRPSDQANQFFGDCLQNSSVSCGNVEFASIHSSFSPENASTGIIHAIGKVAGSALSSVIGTSGAMILGGLLWVLVALRGSAARIDRFSAQAGLLTSLGTDMKVLVISRLVLEAIIHMLVAVAAASIAVLLLVSWALNDLTPESLLPVSVIVLLSCYFPLALVIRTRMRTPNEMRIPNNA